MEQRAQMIMLAAMRARVSMVLRGQIVNTVIEALCFNLNFFKTTTSYHISHLHGPIRNGLV